MNTTRKLRASLIAAAALVATSAGAAHGQAWIGQVVGDMAAQQAAAAAEQACLAGKPADPDDVAKAHTRIEKAMDAFFDLTSTSTPKQIRRTFTTDEKDVRYKDATGDVPLDQLGARLDVPTPQRTLVAMVVGGDAFSAQAIWSVTPVEGSDIAYYAGDFYNEGWFGGWKLWHLQALPESVKPDVPPAYCHFNKEQSF